MPVIDDCDEHEGPDINDDCYEHENPVVIPIILAKFQFGPIDGIIAETHITDCHVEYAEFMLMMYSKTGDLVFHPSTHNMYDLLLSAYEQKNSINCYIKNEFAHEDMSLVVSNLLLSRDLHKLINGPFKACIDIVVASNILQFGIKQRIVFSVASAPYIPTLKICNKHIYQIVIDEKKCICNC